MLSSFGIMSMRPISFLDSAALKTWGDEQLEALINHFGMEKTRKWVDDNNEKKTSTVGPIIEPEATRYEWNEIKLKVLSQMHPRTEMENLWRLIV